MTVQRKQNTIIRITYYLKSVTSLQLLFSFKIMVLDEPKKDKFVKKKKSWPTKKFKEFKTKKKDKLCESEVCFSLITTYNTK